MNQLKKTEVWVENVNTPEFEVRRRGKFHNTLVSRVEKLPNQYCFTEEELKELLNKTFYAGTLHEYGFITGVHSQSQETFINNIFNSEK